MSDAPRPEAKQELKEWLARKKMAAGILAHERARELRSMSSQQSFAEFIDLWNFYTSSPQVHSDLGIEAQMVGHRHKMADLFRKLTRHGR